MTEEQQKEWRDKVGMRCENCTLATGTAKQGQYHCHVGPDEKTVSRVWWCRSFEDRRKA